MAGTGYNKDVRILWSATNIFSVVLSVAAPVSRAQSGGRPSVSGVRGHVTAAPAGPTVVIDTTSGRMTCRLYATEAPELTANFVGLVEGTQPWKDPVTGEIQTGKPFYDGTALMGQTDAIAGGARVGIGMGTAGDLLPKPKPTGLKFDRAGRLAMSQKKDVVSRSMFFITDHADAEMDSGTRGAVFGQCDESTPEKVAAMVHVLLSTENHPNSPIAINKMMVVQPGEPLPPLAANIPAASVVPQPLPAPVASLPAPEPTGPTAVIDTSLGRISCRLFDKEAPIATGIFIGLAEGTKDWKMPKTHALMHGKPLYNGLLFNRVLPDFMIQNQNYPGGSVGGGDIGIKYGVETVPGLEFDRPGRLAMANAGPDTNDSSFFIMEQPRHSGLDGNFTIFGQCDDASVKVVSAISHAPRNAQNRPLTPVLIRRVTISR